MRGCRWCPGRCGNWSGSGLSRADRGHGSGGGMPGNAGACYTIGRLGALRAPAEAQRAQIQALRELCEEFRARPASAPPACWRDC